MAYTHAENGNFLAIDKATGGIVNVRDVPNGDACNCICIACGQALQARLGDIREHHFKHLSGGECNPETVLHLLAKKILQECDRFNLPRGKGYFYYHEVIAEQWLGDQKPDIVLKSADKNVHVEIAVTSFIGVAKKKKIIGAGYNTVEIDLSNLSRVCSYGDLKRIVIEETENKEFINWGEDAVTIRRGNENNTILRWLFGVALMALSWAVIRFFNRKRRRL